MKSHSILILLALMLFIGCGSNNQGFQDSTLGSVDAELQSYVDTVANLALTYNAHQFYERMQYVDVVLSTSEKGQSILNGSEIDSTAFATPTLERVIVVDVERFNAFSSDTERLIVILHEFMHAVSDDCVSDQHIEDVVYVVDSPEPITSYTQPLTMPLSIMSSNHCLDAAYFWDKYSDFYLKTFFGLRLDRFWK